MVYFRVIDTCSDSLYGIFQGGIYMCRLFVWYISGWYIRVPTLCMVYFRVVYTCSDSLSGIFQGAIYVFRLIVWYISGCYIRVPTQCMVYFRVVYTCSVYSTITPSVALYYYQSCSLSLSPLAGSLVSISLTLALISPQV